MNIIEQTRAAVPRPNGFRGVALVELSTGQLLGEVSDTEVGGTTLPLASAVTEALLQLSSALILSSAEEELEDLIITMSGHHHLVRILPGFAGTDAFLLLTLDRSKANLALARHLLRSFEVGLVA